MAMLDLRRFSDRAESIRPVNVAALALLGLCVAVGAAAAWAAQHWWPVAAGVVAGLLLMPAPRIAQQ